MQVSDEMNWGWGDVVLFGALLGGACGVYELTARTAASAAYRAAMGLALGAAFLLVWINLAVGVTGSEDDPANLLHWGVLAVGLLGAVVARFQPRGMALAVAAMALAQALIAPVALEAGSPEGLVLTAVFAALWLASAGLFRKAAREQAAA
jgi:hypothetical protein